MNEQVEVVENGHKGPESSEPTLTESELIKNRLLSDLEKAQKQLDSVNKQLDDVQKSQQILARQKIALETLISYLVNVTSR